MIDRMKLKTKIALLVLAALMGLLILTGLSAMKTHRDLLNSKKDTIQSVLEGVYSTLGAYQAQEAAGKMTRGASQDSCRLIHATNRVLFSARRWSAITASRSGLSVTVPIGDQLRVFFDQRAGLPSRAWR